MTPPPPTTAPGWDDPYADSPLAQALRASMAEALERARADAEAKLGPIDLGDDA